MQQSSLVAVFNQIANDEDSNDGDASNFKNDNIATYTSILKRSLCTALNSNDRNEREAAMLLMMEMIDADGHGRFIRYVPPQKTRE